MTMSKRAAVRALSFLLAAIAVLGGFTFMGWDRAARYERGLQATYQRSYYSLMNSFGNMTTALNKSTLASSSQMLSLLSAQIWQQASEAGDHLAALPSSGVHLDNTSKFISQVGNYAYTLAKKAGSGEGLTDEDRKTMKQLAANAEKISTELSGMMPSSTTYAFYNTPLPDEAAGGKASGESASGLNGGLDLLESAFPEGPTLIYDGPFSEHITGMTPLVTKEREISEQDALNGTAKVLGVSADLIKYTESSDGDIPTYNFEFSRQSGKVNLAVTKNGGRLLSMLEDRDVGETKVSVEEGIKKAGEFLSKAGYADMKDSYYHMSEGILFINFHYTAENVFIYPDLVQVGVALDNGEVCYLDARGYLSSHKTDRDLKPTLSLEQAKSKVSSLLENGKDRLAIIPTPGKNELLCYEFLCKDADKRECLIYVNAKTGAEEQILILLKDDNGVLTH